MLEGTGKKGVRKSYRALLGMDHRSHSRSSVIEVAMYMPIDKLESQYRHFRISE